MMYFWGTRRLHDCRFFQPIQYDMVVLAVAVAVAALALAVAVAAAMAPAGAGRGSFLYIKYKRYFPFFTWLSD